MTQLDPIQTYSPILIPPFISCFFKSLKEWFALIKLQLLAQIVPPPISIPFIAYSYSNRCPKPGRIFVRPGLAR